MLSIQISSSQILNDQLIIENHRKNLVENSILSGSKRRQSDIFEIVEGTLVNNNKRVDLLERLQFNIQSDLLSSFMQDNKKEYKRAKFADVVDQINNELGKSITIYGAQGIQKEPVRFNTAGSNWQMKSYYRSPAYTTRWDELLKVF